MKKYKDNFKDALFRMYESADVLYENGQWLNFSYLAGYVAECYCKLIVCSPLLYAETGIYVTGISLKHSLAGLKGKINTISTTSGTLGPYCIDLNTECATLLKYWNTEIRYKSDGHILNDKAMAQKVKTEMETISEMAVKMLIDGVI